MTFSRKFCLCSMQHILQYVDKAASPDRVYVHCTAGLGRAPAVCIAYMFWFKDMGLDEVSTQVASL